MKIGIDSALSYCKSVVPAKAGTHLGVSIRRSVVMDASFRWQDEGSELIRPPARCNDIASDYSVIKLWEISDERTFVNSIIYLMRNDVPAV